MSFCSMCSHTHDLNRYQDDKTVRAVAFLKRAHFKQKIEALFLCVFCLADVESVLFLQDKYSSYAREDEDQSSLFYFDHHSCITCQREYDKCGDVQTHVLSCKENPSNWTSTKPEDNNPSPLESYEEFSDNYDHVEPLNFIDDSFGADYYESDEPAEGSSTEVDNVGQRIPEKSETLTKELSVVLKNLSQQDIQNLQNSLKSTKSAVEKDLSSRMEEDQHEIFDLGEQTDDVQESDDDDAIFVPNVPKNDTSKRKLKKSSSKNIPRVKKGNNRQSHTGSAARPRFTKCTVCFSSIRPSLISSHMLKKHPEILPSLPCTHCQEQFFTQRHLDWHQRLVMRRSTCYECPECQAKFMRKSGVRNHMKTIHEKDAGTEEFASYIYCCEAFWKLDEFHRHVSKPKTELESVGDDSEARVENSRFQLHPRTDSRFICPRTKKSFKFLSRMLFCYNFPLYIKNSNQDICPICNKVTKMLEEHMSREHTQIYGNFCLKCHKEVEDISEHITKLHYGWAEKSSFECKECGSKHKREDLLRNHIRRKHENLPKAPKTNMVPCEICRKMVKHYYLDRHMSKHSEKERLLCKVCGKTYKTYSSHYNHMKYVHAKIKYNKCATCHAKFEDKSQLREHLKVVHNNKLKHQCQECDWSFNHHGNLVYHVAQVHRREKNKVCDICGKKFGHGSTLLKHKRVHVKKGELEPFPGC